HRGAIRADTGDEAGAVGDLSQALRIDEHYADAFAALATLQMRREHYTEVIANADRAIEFSPQNRMARSTRALARSKMGDLTGAIEDTTEIIKFNSRDPLAYNNRGYFRYQAGDYDGAL